jgi:HPt (histidine-containing phosphotransfer) domain-containing protein
LAAAKGGSAPERAPARQLVHRVVGLAGTIGFKSLSTRAAELESLLTSGDPYGPGHGRELTRALREAFTNDLTAPPDWALDPATPSSSLTILLVEDDPDQRSVVGAYLRAAGHTVHELGSGIRSSTTFGCTVHHWSCSTSRCRASTASPAGPEQTAALEAFRFEVRRRDVVGRYNDNHLVLLLPGMTPGPRATACVTCCGR